MKRLLATLLALSSAANAETFDIVSNGTIYSYSGEWLASDTVGATGWYLFRADDLIAYPAQRSFSSARTQPFGDYELIVSYAGKIFRVQHCREVASTHLGNDTHTRFACAVSP